MIGCAAQGTWFAVFEPLPLFFKATDTSKERNLAFKVSAFFFEKRLLIGGGCYLFQELRMGGF